MSDYLNFINEQIWSTEHAIRLARKAQRTAQDLQDVFDPKPETGEALKTEDFSRDTFKFFDANYAIRDLESLQLQLGDLKTKLIEIKIANDRMLYAGGYLLFVDETISRIFLKNTLCKLKAHDDNTPEVIADAITQLEQMKEKLEDVKKTLS